MKKYYLLLFAIILLTGSSFAQVGINADNSAPDPSAMLDVKSTDKGFLPPRMTTTQMNGIVAPIAGLLVYNSSVNALYWFDGNIWQRFNEFHFNESDPVFALHPASSITIDLLNDWSTAYSWGNHQLAGYLTFYNETDPLFHAHPASWISTVDLDNWNQAYANRLVSAQGNTPMTLQLQNNQLTGSIQPANSVQSGYLSAADWNSFNNKQNALTFGNLTSSDITVTGGNSAVKGSGATLLIKKGNLTETGSSVLTITGGNNAVLGTTGTTLQVKQAGVVQSGYLSSGDWNSFNDKVSSQWTTNGTKLYYNSGNVGLGTSNPGSKFALAGNAAIGNGYADLSSVPINGLSVQGKLGVGTPSPDASASMEVNSTTSGVLLPRMTLDQRNAISSPAEGLMVFCLDCGTKGSLSVYSGSSWNTFSPCISPVPEATANKVTPGQVIWNWNAVPGASGYKWGINTSYSTATDMGSATLKTESGIECNTSYNRYLWSYNTCGVSDPIILTQVIESVPPDTPLESTHTATLTSVTWKWLPVAGATGYKWNMVNDYATAIDKDTSTSHIETGDTCSTIYTRYVWAYNGCGYSAVKTLTQSSLPCWYCGLSTLTINHLATGGVAPVDKSTTYGSVTNIPGEATKCWITNNLGSTQQATSVSDASEASAGWYWQFNRKQGYKHDGSTLTPSWTITGITEDSDWLLSNDPCNLELGTEWRIPTYTEWYNLDNANAWTNWNGPWGSDLKLHAAGGLNNSTGAPNNRGSYGFYWSSIQYNTDNGWSLRFYVSYCNMNTSASKSNGYSVRCLRDN